MDADRPFFGISFGEVVSFQHSGNRYVGSQFNNICKIEFGQPGCIKLDPGFGRIQNLKYLLFVSLGIAMQLFLG
jgi:hypothetical protein